MVERIQYLLILLLFVLVGSLDGVSFGQEICGTQSVLTQPTDSDSLAPIHNYLSAWTHTCDTTAETPVISFEHRAVVRQRAAVRAAVDAAFDVRMAIRSLFGASHPDAVDYYVFSLERILI